MKNILLITISLILFAFPSRVSAHALDDLSFFVFTETNQRQEQFEENTAYIAIDLGFAHIQTLFSGQETSDQILEEYIRSNFVFSNNGNACELVRYSEPYHSEVLKTSLGVQLEFLATCQNSIENITIDVSAFDTEIPTQTKYGSIFKTPDLAISRHTLAQGQTQVSVDLNGEQIEEVFEEQGVDIENESSNDSRLYQFIVDNIENADLWGLMLIFGVSILIGALHALEGGHSKLILASLLINQKVSMKKGIGFVTVFTFPHLADIFIVAIVLLFFSGTFTSIYNSLSIIQRYAVFGMILISAYLVAKESWNLYRSKKAKHDHSHDTHHDYNHDHHHGHEHSRDHEHSHSHDHFDLNKNSSFKQQLTIAFLEGLAPCLTGWAILLLIISTEMLYLIIPVVLAFGVGVFIVLFTFMALVHKFKEAIYTKVSFIGKYSPLVSAFLLLATAVVMVVSITS